jgi:protein TonB
LTNSVAYRSDINTRDRGGAIALVIAIHAALLFAFLHLSGKIDLTDTQEAMSLFDFNKPPPAPPPPKPAQQSKPKEKEGGSSPKNLRSEATPVVAPKPQVVTPPLQQIAATDTPRQGAEATQGASDVKGPGTGAGGLGNGTGSGSGGNGPGGGGNEAAEPPHLVTPVLSGRDFPPVLIDEWPGGATVFLRLRVEARGYVSECLVDRGTGVTSIDSMMCNLAHERLRFRPALNRSGQAVAGWFGYAQPAPR